MAQAQRLDSLRQKHHALQDQISRHEKSSYINTQELRKLKLQKLKLKEEIDQLQSA
jgi:hypothetical protein